MFIAHDLSVVKHILRPTSASCISVRWWRWHPSDELFAHPLHPYTQSLLSAIPLPDPHSEKKRTRIIYNKLAEHDYSQDKPTMRELVPGHFVYCNDAEEKKYKQELGI